MAETEELHIETGLTVSEAATRIQDELDKVGWGERIIAMRSRLHGEVDHARVRLYRYRGDSTFSEFRGTLVPGSGGAVLQGQFLTPSVDVAPGQLGLVSVALALVGLWSLFSGEIPKSLLMPAVAAVFPLAARRWIKALRRNAEIDIDFLRSDIERIFLGTPSSDEGR